MAVGLASSGPQTANTRSHTSRVCEQRSWICIEGKAELSSGRLWLLSDSWERISFPFAQAAPAIQITGVPAYGTNGSMTGTVSGVDYTQYCVSPYIQIKRSGWWTKPTFAATTVAIDPNGTFSANVTSGGVDDQATIYYAAVVPIGSTTPWDWRTSAPVISDSVASASLERYGSTVQFAGYAWGVKQSSLPVGPGSNLFAAQNVWVNGQGRLHLQISQSGGQWYSAEAICPAKLGYWDVSLHDRRAHR